MQRSLDRPISNRSSHGQAIALSFAGAVALIVADVALAQGLSHFFAPTETQAIVWAYQPVIWCGWTALMFWNVFPKAGVPRWWSAVPFLNVVGLCRVAGRPWWWIPAYLTPTAVLIGLSLLVFRAEAPSQQALANNPYAGVLPSAADLVFVGLMVVVFIVTQATLWIGIARRVSASFGHRGAFTAGLLLLPFLFYPMLGLNNDRYTTLSL